MRQRLIIAHLTHAAAASDLNLQISEKYGSDPGVLDELTFQTLPVRLKGTDEKEMALVAYPTAKGADCDELMIAMIGKPRP